MEQGKTWTHMGPDDEPITRIAVSPVPGRVYAAAPDGRFFRSADGGDTWEERGEGLTVRSISALHLDPADPDRLYASTTHGIWVLEEED